MRQEHIDIQGIPALVWGEPSDKVYLCVHGKMSCKESVEGLARIAEEKGYQTISFDLPQHGERQGESDRCDIWNGVHDLTVVADYVFSRWQEVSLYACSLGAFFALHAYKNYTFRKCLFQSPILDMEYLIGQMMLWFDVTEERLEKILNTVFFSTHVLEVAEKLCTRIGIIDHGQLIAEGTMDELRQGERAASLEELFLERTEEGGEEK